MKKLRIVIQFKDVTLKSKYYIDMVKKGFDVVEFPEFNQESLQITIDDFVQGALFSYITTYGNQNTLMYNIYNNEIEFLKVSLGDF